MSVDNQHLSRVIFQYAGRIGREQDREALLALIADLGRDLVEADRCSIWMVDAATGQLATRVAHGSGVIRIWLGQGLVGHCVTTGSVVLVNNVEHEPRFASPVDESTGYHTRSVLAVPMRSADGTVIGAFQALNKPGGFDPSDADLLSLAAAYSASTIETQMLIRRAEEARRMELELAIAREVQQRLLPGKDLPAVAGLEYAGLCRPAEEVGGDYYTFLPQPDGGLVMALGDISGKGIAAALLMASVQASLHGLVLSGKQEPYHLVTKLNELVCDCAVAGRYSTLFFARYEPKSRAFTYVNAGHVYPILARADGPVERLDQGGPPLGLMPDSTYTQEKLTLGPGDTLVCFSDGFSDARDQRGYPWGGGAVRMAVLQAGLRPVQDVCAHIVKEADRFAQGVKQFDDMTVVCLRASA